MSEGFNVLWMLTVSFQEHLKGFGLGASSAGANALGREEAQSIESHLAGTGVLTASMFGLSGCWTLWPFESLRNLVQLLLQHVANIQYDALSSTSSC